MSEFLDDNIFFYKRRYGVENNGVVIYIDMVYYIYLSLEFTIPLYVFIKN